MCHPCGNHVYVMLAKFKNMNLFSQKKKKKLFPSILGGLTKKIQV